MPGRPHNHTPDDDGESEGTGDGEVDGLSEASGEAVEAERRWGRWAERKVEWGTAKQNCMDGLLSDQGSRNIHLVGSGTCAGSEFRPTTTPLHLQHLPTPINPPI